MGHMSSRKQDKETKHTKTMNWEKPNRKRRQSEGRACPSSPQGPSTYSPIPPQASPPVISWCANNSRFHRAEETVPTPLM